MTEFRIDQRFEGLPGVTHGGYIAGLVAKGLGPSVSVTLTRAVPVGSAVVIAKTDTGQVLNVDGAVAATALVDDVASTAPGSISVEQAEHASAGYLGFAHHFFPRCITCGPELAVGEGLRIFTGPVDGRPLVASLWDPPTMVRQADGTLASEYLWAALDCPAIWGVVVHGENQLDDRAVSGRLALHQIAPVASDRSYVVIGWPIERHGRKVVGGAAIYSDAGELLVEARQTMILTDRGIPLHLSAWKAFRSTAT